MLSVSLIDEHDAVQKKTFTKWINAQFSKVMRFKANSYGKSKLNWKMYVFRKYMKWSNWFYSTDTSEDHLIYVPIRRNASSKIPVQNILLSCIAKSWNIFVYMLNFPKLKPGTSGWKDSENICYSQYLDIHLECGETGLLFYINRFNKRHWPQNFD